MYFKTAADEGNAEAEYDLAFCYLASQGVEEDDFAAVKWLQKSADQGFAQAEYSLGYCYENGTGLGQDPAKAMEYYQKAGQQGFMGAKTGLKESAPVNSPASTTTLEPPGAGASPAVEYSIPPDVMKKARKESKTPEGNKYDGEMFPGNPMDILGPECMNGEQALGWVTLVLIIQADGNVSKVYAKEHGKAYDCLAPKFASAKLTPPPHSPFYKLFELNIKK